MSSAGWVSYLISMGLAVFALWTATTKPLESSVIWLTVALIIVVRAEGKFTRDKVEAKRG